MHGAINLSQKYKNSSKAEIRSCFFTVKQPVNYVIATFKYLCNNLNNISFSTLYYAIGNDNKEMKRVLIPVFKKNFIRTNILSVIFIYLLQ